MVASQTVVKVMADYGAHPLWVQISDGVRNLAPTEFDVSPELAEDLLAWSETYQAILNWDDPVSSAFPTDEAEVEFAVRGLALARRLSAELGPDWLVEYFDVRQRSAYPITAGTPS